MKPVRRALYRALLALVLILPAAVGCGSGTTPGGSPPSGPPTTTAPTASPTVSPTQAPTTPAPVASTTAPSALSGWSVVSSRVAYPWRWPGGDPVKVAHTYPVPPVAELVAIGAGDHANEAGDRPYNRMTFGFTGGYPSYTFQYVQQLVADGSGQPIPLDGLGVLRIVFTPAQAHIQDGSVSSIRSAPPPHLGMSRMVAYKQAGDFEGYLSYGVGITWPVPHSNPQIAVRVYEVTYANAQGEHRYVVALDVDAR